jgi:hypothetical protein
LYYFANNLERKEVRVNVRVLAVFSFLLLLFAGTSLVQAASYSFEPIPRDLYDLAHKHYYTWGIDASDLASDLASGATIDSAQLVISSINDWTMEDNDVLHMWLVDELPDVPWWVKKTYGWVEDKDWPGVSRGTDDEGTGDAFADCGGTWLMDYTDESPEREDLPVDIPVAALTNYILNDGDFGLALDPDCHYYNRGLRLTINTSPSPPPHVPEPATMLGVFTGLGALAGYLRKRRRTVV